MANPFEVPLVVKRDVADTYGKLRDLALLNCDTIFIEKDEDFEFHLRGIGGNSIFYFKITNPIFDSGNSKTLYSLDFAPHTTINIDSKQIRASSANTVSNGASWLSMLKENNSLKLHPKDEQTNQYKEELDGWFEIVDEDAETTPFDTDRQVLITNIINKSILALKEHGLDDDDEIIQDAIKLKQKVSQLTKKQVVDEGKKIGARVWRKKGVEVLSYILDVINKENIKMSYKTLLKGVTKPVLTLIDSALDTNLSELAE